MTSSGMTSDMTSLLTQTMTMTTASPDVDVEVQMMTEVAPSYDYETATFEIILPAIFGIFISLTLG